MKENNGHTSTKCKSEEFLPKQWQLFLQLIISIKITTDINRSFLFTSYFPISQNTNTEIIKIHEQIYIRCKVSIGIGWKKFFYTLKCFEFDCH